MMDKQFEKDMKKNKMTQVIERNKQIHGGNSRKLEGWKCASKHLIPHHNYVSSDLNSEC